MGALRSRRVRADRASAHRNAGLDSGAIELGIASENVIGLRQYTANGVGLELAYLAPLHDEWTLRFELKGEHEIDGPSSAAMLLGGCEYLFGRSHRLRPYLGLGLGGLLADPGASDTRDIRGGAVAGWLGLLWPGPAGVDLGFELFAKPRHPLIQMIGFHFALAFRELRASRRQPRRDRSLESG